MKILYVTTIGATMAFFETLIEELIKDGHTVDIATNDSTRKVPDCYRDFGCRVFSLSCSRSPFSKGNLNAIGQVRRLVEKENYDIVHCHTPNASIITRLACRKLRKKKGLRVFYTAHGFHFYKGAPIKNWLLYYPVEKFCSRFTDKLITINQEDYELAKNKFRAGEICYVPGVGTDLSKFENVSVDRAAKRREIGVPGNALLLLSVGELNENKNHRMGIETIARLNDSNIHYAIAGMGDNRDCLLGLAKELGVSDQVHFLGYREDVAELYAVSDVFFFPSFREGLSVSLMEAMACGLPVVCSRIRGNTDLILQGGGELFDPHSKDDCFRAVSGVLGGDMKLMGETNKARSQNCSIDKIVAQMKTIYES